MKKKRNDTRHKKIAREGERNKCAGVRKMGLGCQEQNGTYKTPLAKQCPHFHGYVDNLVIKNKKF